jgi:DNA-binding transcriptional LysR family regulator
MTVHINQMKYFATLYEARNYSLAAKRIPISVQGLTKAIRRIEESLGITVFTLDDTGALQTTEYADEFYRFVTQFDHNWLLLEESIKQIKAREQHEIRLGACLGMLGVLGPEFFIELYKAHPDITINVNEYNDLECDLGLRRNYFDLAFTVSPYESEFVTTELFCSDVGYWMRKENPLSQKSSLAIADFEGQHIAIPGKAYKVYNTLTAACQKQGVTFGDVYEISELFRIFEFVLAGYGLGFSIRQVSELSVFKSNDAVVFVPTEDAKLRFGIAYQPSHGLSEPEQRFYDFCITYAQTLNNQES